MKPTITATDHRHESAASAAAIAIWPADRPGILRLLECRLLHRADWQYLGTRNDDAVAPWPIDSYRCGQCDRAWDKVN